MNGHLLATRTYSLRRRLILFISISMLAVLVLAGLFSYQQARKDVREMMDATMTQSATLLLAQASRTPASLGELPNLFETLKGINHRHHGFALEFRIGRADGTLLAHTAHAPITEFTGTPGFDNVKLAGQAWRSLVVTTASGDLRIQMLQSARQRNKEALEIAFKATLPLLLLLPVLFGLIILAVRQGLMPLNELATQVSLRSSSNLEPLPSTATPLETRPLIDALNQMLTRIGQSIENERRFTADAAHELRTPLSAIRIQAQVALASSDGEQHRHALNQVVAGTQRATRLVEQLLRLARLDPLAAPPDCQLVDLTEIAGTVCAEARINHPAHSETLVEEFVPGAPKISGNRDLLTVSLRNLLENALRHAPAGLRIAVFVRQVHGEALLGVADAGPGVKPEDLPKLVERFYRSSDASTEGSGLGLAIVHRIAELHGARLEICNLAEGGFLAQLRWPATAVIAEAGPAPANQAA